MFQSGSGSPKSYAHQPPITYGFNRAWDQPEWHINPTHGNDRNVGDTEFNPLPAVDPTTWAYTANRAYSFANLAATVAVGGFGGNIFDPLNPSTAIVIGD